MVEYNFMGLFTPEQAIKNLREYLMPSALLAHDERLWLEALFEWFEFHEEKDAEAIAAFEAIDWDEGIEWEYGRVFDDGDDWDEEGFSPEEILVTIEWFKENEPDLDPGTLMRRRVAGEWEAVPDAS